MGVWLIDVNFFLFLNVSIQNIEIQKWIFQWAPGSLIPHSFWYILFLYHLWARKYFVWGSEYFFLYICKENFCKVEGKYLKNVSLWWCHVQGKTYLGCEVFPSGSRRSYICTVNPKRLSHGSSWLYKGWLLTGRWQAGWPTVRGQRINIYRGNECFHYQTAFTNVQRKTNAED